MQLAAQEQRIRRSWDSPEAPTQRAQFSIIPLVLDGNAELHRAGHAVELLRGFGLAEYYNARLWGVNPNAVRV